MKAIAIIPARYGSTRFPGKPLADILGKPMIQHVYEKVARSKCINNVIVATDDERIKLAVEKFGGIAVLTAKNHITGTDRIAEIARSEDVDIVINVQGDEPLISSNSIDIIIEPLLKNPHIYMSTLMTCLPLNDYHNPNIVKVIVNRYCDALYFSRSLIPYSRSKDDIFRYKHIGLYAYKREFLLDFVNLPQGPLEKSESLEQLRALENGYKIRCIYVEEDTIGVDMPADLTRVILKLRGEMDE